MSTRPFSQEIGLGAGSVAHQPRAPGQRRKSQTGQNHGLERQQALPSRD
jgi:hypothetical protein